MTPNAPGLPPRGVLRFSSHSWADRHACDGARSRFLGGHCRSSGSLPHDPGAPVFRRCRAAGLEFPSVGSPRRISCLHHGPLGSRTPASLAHGTLSTRWILESLAPPCSCFAPKRTWLPTERDGRFRGGRTHWMGDGTIRHPGAVSFTGMPGPRPSPEVIGRQPRPHGRRTDTRMRKGRGADLLPRLWRSCDVLLPLRMPTSSISLTRGLGPRSSSPSPENRTT